MSESNTSIMAFPRAPALRLPRSPTQLGFPPVGVECNAVSKSAGDLCDVIEDMLLRMIANSGKKAGESFSSITIRPAFETLRFPRPFADVLASLRAKGLIGGDGEIIHLTETGSALTRS